MSKEKKMDIENCIVCKNGVENLQFYNAEFSPWIKNKIITNSSRVRLIRCSACCSLFFDYRYSEVEIKKIYENYRSAEYALSRDEYEPGYTKLNAQIGNNELELRNRKKNLSNIIKKINLEIEIRTLLDYGGDRGQFIPDDFRNVKKYVYDISDSEVVDGVHKLNEVDGKYFDFIMCCHTLEHVNEPLNFLKLVAQHVIPNGYLYLELPLDMPFREYVSLALNVESIMPDLSPMLMHEHINFYSNKSVDMMAGKLGFEVVYNEIHNIDQGWNKAPIIAAVLRNKKVLSNHTSQSSILKKTLKLFQIKLSNKISLK